MKSLLILLTVISAVTCSLYGRGGYIDAIERCNEYVDELLTTAVKKNNLESYPIYGRELNFKKKVIFYTFKGHANLTEGFITGLGDIHRKSPCSLSFDTGRLKLQAQLEAKEIKFNFTALLTVIGTAASVSVEAVTSPLKIDLAFAFNATTGNDGLLESFRPHVIDHMNVWINELGYLDWVRKPMEESTEHLFYDIINTLTHQNLRNALDFGIKEKSFPVEDLKVIDITSVEPKEDIVVTTPGGKKDYSKEDSDSYIDMILSNRFMVEAKYSKIDPYILNDVRLDEVFIRKQEPQKDDINFVKLGKGVLEHLSNLKRKSDCSAPKFLDRNVTFTCNLVFNELTMKYIAEAHNDTQVYNFNLGARILETSVSVKITSSFKDNVPTVQEYSIDDIGRISITAAIDIAGSRLMTPSAIETLYNSKVILKYFFEELNSILKGRLREVLSYSIYKTPLPFLDS